MNEKTKSSSSRVRGSTLKDRDVIRKSDQLLGKNIALAVCGGIAAVETIKLARELRRHGAMVRAFITPSVEAFIMRTPLEWATSMPVVASSTSEVEYLEDFDLVLVAPTTLNTLAKASVGIADNAVSLLIAGQLGRRGKILFVPTMNEDLWEHPATKEHIARLEKWGAEFLLSEKAEGRLKMPELETIVRAALKCVGA